MMTNKLRALTSAARAELAKLNPLLSPPNCLERGANGEKRLFPECFKAFPKRSITGRKCSLRVEGEKLEWGIKTQNLGGEFSSGNGSVHIHRSILSFTSLFSSFPLCCIRKKLK